MLLNGLDVTNNRGTVLSLPLEDVSAGFVVKEIKGLDPVKATIVSSSFANMDGEQYHSARRESRNIILTLGLEPDYASMSVEELRKELYNFFMPKTTTNLNFKMFDKFQTNYLLRNLSLFIDGRIESFDAPLFTDAPEASISIICFDPNFYDPNEQFLLGDTVSDLTATTVTYDGSIETGVIFRLALDRALDAFTIYNVGSDQMIQTIDFQMDLLTNDVVEIGSVFGSKYAKLIRAGVESSVLYAISPQSAWLTFQPGDNDLRVYAEGAGVPYTITYTNKYGGL